MPGYWRCDAVVDVDQLVDAPVSGGSAEPSAPPAPRRRGPHRCGTVYPQSVADDGAPPACRCGMPAIGECSECTRAVCEDHSALWRGWRVCDRDLANARMKARAREAEEERRAKEVAAAAEAERLRRRTTLLDLTEEEALWLLYVQDPRTEQELRSAVHILRSVPTQEFTELCRYVLPTVSDPVKTRRSGLRRLSGWAFAGPHYHDRSWFLTRKGEWYRSGSYGDSGAEQGHRGKKVRLDDTEKRAIIYDMSWQHSVSGTLPA
jgi:hypothetical protein